MYRFIAVFSSCKDVEYAIEEKIPGFSEKLSLFERAFTSSHFELYTQEIEGPFKEPDLRVWDDQIFMGELYGDVEEEDLIEWVSRDRFPGVRREGALDGKYLFFVVKGNALHVFRDPLGLKPLYASKIGPLFLFSSEKKYLWLSGAREIFSLTPNHLYEFEGESFSPKMKCVDFSPHPKLSVSLEDSIERMVKMLSDRMERLLRDVRNVGVAFSGGVDSSLTARLASLVGKEVTLITVGLRGSRDLERAAEAARTLDLPLVLMERGLDDVAEDVPEAVRLVEEADIMKIGVALPFLWVSRYLRESSTPVMVTGQGSDEVYAGYDRYLRIYRDLGEKAVEEAILQGVLQSHLINFERDEKVVSNQGVQLRYPLISPEAVSYALRLPLRFKISSVEDEHRKIIIRKVAERMGLPERTAWGRKKSLQYSTLTDKAIRKLAKTKGRSPEKYLKDIFEKLFPPNTNSG